MRVSLTAPAASPSMAKTSTVSRPASAADLQSSERSARRPKIWRRAIFGVWASSVY